MENWKEGDTVSETEIKSFNCNLKTTEEKQIKAQGYLKHQDVKNAWLTLLK